jgi:hypothetical protein
LVVINKLEYDKHVLTLLFPNVDIEVIHRIMVNDNKTVLAFIESSEVKVTDQQKESVIALMGYYGSNVFNSNRSAPDNGNKQHDQEETGQIVLVELKPVQSSNIKSIAYENGTLYVKFKVGTVYSYSNVSKEEYTDLLSNPSIGRGLMAIKETHAAKKIK